MAIIGSIRKRGTLIVVIVGISLAAFVLGGSQFINLFSPDNTTIGSFNGSKFSIIEYNKRIEDKTGYYQTINPGMEMTDEAVDQIKDEVWEDILREKVFEKQYEVLGLKLSEAEINDLFVGETASDEVKGIGMFINPQTGQFDPNAVQNFSQKFEDQGNREGEELQQWIIEKAYWGYFQHKQKNDRYQAKYTNMVTKGLYVTTKEATSLYKANSDHANIRFIAKPYAAIADSTVQFTEEELVNFFKEHKYRMRAHKSKAIRYAVFLSIPTVGDSAALRNNIIQLRDELATTDDDTVFVAQNSEESIPPTFFKKGVINTTLDSLLFAAPRGTVAGPTIENGYYLVAKKLEERMIPDSSKISHIIIQPKENTEQAVQAALALRDSIYDMLKRGGDFVALSAQYGMDGTAKDSGKIGWVSRLDNSMDRNIPYLPYFRDSIFVKRKGDLVKANSQYGFHVVYIQDQTELIKESQIAMIVKAIVPSDDTKKIQYNLASEMAFPKDKPKDFDPAKYMENFAKKNNLIYREEPSITEASKNILSMEDTKPVVKWALGAKRGDISDIFESGHNYLVAVVTATRPEGIPALNDVRDEAIAALRQHKKAEQFIGEFNSAMATTKDIGSLAAAMKLNVATANDIAFGNYFVPGAGVEPELLGTAFGMKVNQMSKPVEGKAGVFVLVVDQFNPAPALPDYTFIKKDIMRSYANRASDALLAVKEKANVKDNRYKFDIF